jgi:UDP-4-amino-4,6-dideoxy-N-acetyl-beta-L-altrosamine transaminase
MAKLAIHGGIPQCKGIIPYGRQDIVQEDIDAVVNVLKGDYLTTGPFVKEFEEKLTQYVGAKYAVAFSNGTAALHGACFAAGLGAGDEVITSAITFAASANCALYVGATPVFADIKKDTYNIDPVDIERKITEKTKAIIPVHFTGQAVELDEITAIAKKYNLRVIEDAAHAIGTRYKERMVGSISDMTEFSFHPVKTITTGEGGAVTTNDEQLYKRLKLFVTHGITRDANLLESRSEGAWYYEQQELGYNYRITDLQCALGTSQLARIGEFKAKRSMLVKKYDNELRNIEGIIIQKEIPESDTSRHLYIMQLELERFNASRKEIFDALRAENVGVNVHYIPVYYHPYYKQLGYQKGLCPQAEKLYERIITLPLHPLMTDNDQDDIIKAVEKVLDYYRK